MKVRIAGETYDWDGNYTYQEGVAIERQTGMSFLDWNDRMQGAERERCAGSDVPLEGITTQKVGQIEVGRCPVCKHMTAILDDGFVEHTTTQAPISDIGVMLWIIARRAHPGLAYEDFDFPIYDWSIEPDEGETVDPTGDGSSTVEMTT